MPERLGASLVGLEPEPRVVLRPVEVFDDTPGQLGFAAPEGWPGFELAWTLARRWWGNGYATEGARAALDYAFTALGKDRVISLIHPENRASIRVAERIGERLQGSVDHLGREMLCYGIDRESYVPLVGPAARPGVEPLRWARDGRRSAIAG